MATTENIFTEFYIWVSVHHKSYTQQACGHLNLLYRVLSDSEENMESKSKNCVYVLR